MNSSASSPLSDRRSVPILVAATLLRATVLFLPAAPVGAQVPTVLFGRVEDAFSRAPIAGARVLSADSTSAVFTDSSGEFAIQIDRADLLSLHIEQYGYLAQRFDLPEDAQASISVLLLEPVPIELEGIKVVEESALTELLGDLRGRRNSYQGSVSAFDRERLQRYAAGGSAWDFVRMRAPRVFECNSGLSGLCVRGRSRTFRIPNPEVPVRICVDAWESWGAISELETLDVAAVALVEIYG